MTQHKMRFESLIRDMNGHCSFGVKKSRVVAAGIKPGKRYEVEAVFRELDETGHYVESVERSDDESESSGLVRDLNSLDDECRTLVLNRGLNDTFLIYIFSDPFSIRGDGDLLCSDDYCIEDIRDIASPLWCARIAVSVTCGSIPSRHAGRSGFSYHCATRTVPRTSRSSSWLSSGFGRESCLT